MKPAKTLVTGATGYIGGRFCERMRLHWGLPYRAMVHNYTRAARIARLDSEMVKADLLSAESVERAAEGCDAIAHFAFGADTKTETQNVVRAALKHRVKRFVHVSSMAVHGFTPGPEGSREETAIIGHYNSEYSDQKAEAELLVQRAIDKDGLPGVIVRPTVVYGPYSGFVLRVIGEAKTGTVTLIDGGTGICNAVYVDDVCSSVFAGLTTETGQGLAYHINGADRMTWKDFNTVFARMVSPDVEMVSISSREILDHWASQKPTMMTNVREAKKLAMSREFHQQLARIPAVKTAITFGKNTGKKVLSPERVRRLKGDGIPPAFSADGARSALPDEGRVSREVFPIYFEIERARAKLPWKPAFSFQEGSKLTGEWLRFARFIDSRP